MTAFRAAAALFVLVLAGCARTVDFYAEHPEERSRKLKECRHSTPIALESGECKNALLAEQRASAATATPGPGLSSRDSRTPEPKQITQQPSEARSPIQSLDPRRGANSASSSDAAEDLRLTAVSSTQVQERLVRFASELNQGNAQSAGAVLHLLGAAPTELLQLAAAGGGFTSVQQESFDRVGANATRPARIIARVTLRTAKNARPEFGTAGTTTCVRFTYEVSASSTPDGLSGFLRDLEHKHCLP